MILFDILAFPLVAPVKGTIWVLEQLQERARAELYDPEKLKGDIIQLRISYERGMIPEEEYSRQSKEIWERLKLATANLEGDDSDTTDE
jgi:hypothetical protein